jgi:hypothetical protein
MKIAMFDTHEFEKGVFEMAKFATYCAKKYSDR